MCHKGKCECFPFFFHFYEIYAKSSKTEAANEDRWQIQHEIFTSSHQSCGKPCFAPLRDGRQAQGAAVRCRSWRSQSYEIPPEVSPTCACWGLTERNCRGDAKHFLRTHKSLFNGFPLARSSLRRWCLLFITNTLKDEQPHELLRVTPPPNPPPAFLFFTVPPNDTYACM